MAIIGTAGHIDHGKSALIQALTSIDPDRLPEEKEREMSIDLGFAWLRVSSGEVVGIVDVPGHEDFVKTMIAGVGGIDAALLIIAADEGWMPQTEEHLRILDLLQIKHGIVVLNKIDVVDEPGWLDLIEEDVRGRLKETALFDVPIVRVSAKRGTNIGELRQRLEELVLQVIPKRDTSKPVESLYKKISLILRELSFLLDSTRFWMIFHNKKKNAIVPGIPRSPMSSPWMRGGQSHNTQRKTSRAQNISQYRCPKPTRSL